MTVSRAALSRSVATDGWRSMGSWWPPAALRVAATAALCSVGALSAVVPAARAQAPRPLPANLAGVVHRAHARRLPTAARTQLAKQRSVVVAGREAHFFSLYDRNAYEGLPSFVTVDAVLHLVHVRLDGALAAAERAVALPALRAFARAQEQAALRQIAAAPGDPHLRRLALLHAVPAALLADDVPHGSPREPSPPLPADLAPALAEELQRVRRARGAGRSPVCPRLTDFTMLAPRGHYERGLGDYFRAQAYYSLCALDLTRADELRLAVDTLRLLDAGAWEQLETLRGLAEAVAGRGDDLGPAALRSLVGELPPLPAPVPAKTLAALQARLATLPAPRVAEQAGPGEGPRTVFRLLPQAGTPDSALLSRTTRPGVRAHPSALDLLAALGSKDARGVLAGADGVLPPLLAEALAQPLDLSGAGLYGRWLQTLGLLVGDATPGGLAFMRSPAWARHQTVAAASSWAELRHDTLLYVKQPIVWMQGGHDEELPASRAGGYVEPRPDLYQALGELLDSIGAVFPGATAGPDLRATRELLEFLTAVAKRELSGAPMLPAWDKRLRSIGAEMERLVRGRADELPPQALVADVFTLVEGAGAPRVLHAGVGAVDELWVVVPRGRGQLLTRGGVFSYYELVTEPGERLTDRSWVRRLRDQPPPRPAWARPVGSARPARARKRHRD